jgi:hypothetical protein
MKKFIIISSVVVFSLMVYVVNSALRWNHYDKYPYSRTKKIEIATNIDNLVSYNPNKEYFEEVMVTEYWRAGTFPFIDYTKTEKNLGVFSRNK